MSYTHDPSRKGFSLEGEQQFVNNTYAVVKVIKNPFNLHVNGGEAFLGIYNRLDNKFQFTYGKYDSCFMIAEMALLDGPTDYAEYLRSIDPTNLREDYYRGYLERCEKYGITPKPKRS